MGAIVEKAGASVLSYPNTVLNALPHPVFVLSEDRTFIYANNEAESFFQTGIALLKSRDLDWFIPQNSPLGSLIEQVQKTHRPVSEYRVDLSSPRMEESGWVDVYVSPVEEGRADVVVMLHVRSIAEKLDRQLTHRGAARTVTGLAAMLAHEIKNPLSSIRGAAQLLDSFWQRGRPSADTPDYG